jgi:hypothetical protein
MGDRIMTPVTVYDTSPMGDIACPCCGGAVYVAWDERMVRVTLDPDPDGTFAVLLDDNRLPWCRDARGELPFEQRLYRLHSPERCAALADAMASVRLIGTARSVRQARRQTGTGRRLAGVR